MSDSTSHPKDRLPDLLDQTLDPRDRAALQAHVSGCAECRQTVAQLVELKSLLKASPVLTPPENFYRGVTARMAQSDQAIADGGDRRRSGSSTAWWGDPYKTLAGFGVLAIVVLAVYKKDNVMRPAEVVTDSFVKVVSTPQGGAAPVVLSADTPVKEISFQAKKYDGTDLDEAPAAPRRAAAMSKHVMAAIQGDQKSAGSLSDAAKNESLRDLSGRGAAAGSVPVMDVQPMAAAQSIGGENRLDKAQVLNANLMDRAREGVQEWKGNVSRIVASRTVVIRSDADWQTLWAEHTAGMIPAPARPLVDFQNQMVVGVFSGSKPTSGYAVSILSITPGSSAIEVDYQEQSPSADKDTAQVLTEPYHLRVIPTSALPVQFKKS